MCKRTRSLRSSLTIFTAIKKIFKKERSWIENKERSCTCKMLERLIRKFVSGHTEGQKGVHLVKWSKVMQPKKYGGLGLTNLEAQNQAFTYKLIFNSILIHRLMKVQVLSCKYGLCLSDNPLPLSILPPLVWYLQTMESS